MFAATACVTSGNAAAEQHRRLSSLVAANHRCCESVRDREAIEKRLMAAEEANSKAREMEIEAFRCDGRLRLPACFRLFWPPLSYLP